MKKTIMVLKFDRSLSTLEKEQLMPKIQTLCAENLHEHQYPTLKVYEVVT